MLWLAGLLGIVGAGAASFIISPVEDEDAVERSDVADDAQGDLLDQIKGLSESDPASGETLLHRIALDPNRAGIIDERGPDPLDEPDGYDRMIAGHGDAFADRDHDAPIMLGDWITEGPPAEVLDYEPAKDSLMLVWDDLAPDGHEPTVSVESDPFDAEVMHIVMNGKSVAEIYGDPALSVADITTIPLSSALIVGLEPA